MRLNLAGPQTETPSGMLIKRDHQLSSAGTSWTPRCAPCPGVFRSLPFESALSELQLPAHYVFDVLEDVFYEG